MENNTQTFPYSNWEGKQVEAKGYSVYQGTTKDYYGKTLYQYTFLIVTVDTQEKLFKFHYTGTVAPE